MSDSQEATVAVFSAIIRVVGPGERRERDKGGEDKGEGREEDKREMWRKKGEIGVKGYSGCGGLWREKGER